MKILMTTTMVLGAVCILTMNQPAEARRDGHGYGHGHYGHGYGHGGYYGGHRGNRGIGLGLGLGLGAGVLGTTIYNQRTYAPSRNCVMDDWGNTVCYNNYYY